MVDSPTVSRVTGYLTDRPQFVRLGAAQSGVVVSDVGAPQASVPSPFLFTLHTSDSQSNSEWAHLQTISEDSAEVGCISGGREEEDRAGEGL